jgi:hypothetical protein
MNYQIGKSLNRDIMHYALCIIHYQSYLYGLSTKYPVSNLRVETRKGVRHPEFMSQTQFLLPAVFHMEAVFFTLLQGKIK